jgi:uncharacterized protein
MNAASDPGTPLDDRDIERLQSALDRVPPPLEPLDVTALDGFLCGVVLQPQAVAPADWLAHVTDVDGRALPPGFDALAIHALALRRHAEIERAIAARDWFDPWIFELEDSRTPSESMLPWVAGFAVAMERFPALMQIDSPELVEPLALLYMHFDADDLDDADALREVIEELEPPHDLAEAVQDAVRALMLIADVTRPRPATPAPRAAARRGPPAKRAPRGRR